MNMPNVTTKIVKFKKEHTPKHSIPIQENSFGRIIFRNKSTDYCICKIDGCGQIVTSAKGSQTTLFNHIEHHSKMETAIISNSKKRPRIVQLSLLFTLSSIKKSFDRT